MAHDPKLIEYLQDNLELFDSNFAVEILDAINASGTHWVAPWEAPIKEGAWESTFNADTYESAELWEMWRDAYLAEH